MKYYLDMSQIEQVHEFLYEKELSEGSLKLLESLHFQYTDYPHFFPERYDYPFRLKKDYFEPLLKGESSVYLDFNKIDKANYSLEIYTEVLNHIKNTSFLFWYLEDENAFREKYSDEIEQKKRLFNGKIFLRGSELGEYLESIITEEEILTNTIKQEHRVGLKRYGAGGRLTRLLSALTDVYMLSGVKDKYIGNMLASSAPLGIQLSTHPITGYIAGLISSSCLEPEGCNKHAGIIYNGYYNTAMLHSKDLDWRAFISVDFAAKKFTINKGYPRENYGLQYMIKKYFEEQGFTFVTRYFGFPEYFDSSTLFTGEIMSFENKDACYPYSEEDSITGIQGITSIAGIYHSDYNDTYDFDPEHVYAENDDYIWCDYEDNEYYYRDVYWSDYLDSYVSEYGESLFINNNSQMIYETYIKTIAETISEELAAKITENDVDRLGIAYDILRETNYYIGDVTFNILTEYEKEMSREDKLDEARRVEITFFDILPNYS